DVGEMPSTAASSLEAVRMVFRYNHRTQNIESPDNAATLGQCRSSAPWRPGSTLARDPDGNARRDHLRDHRPSLWPRRAAAAAFAAVLVSGLRRCHGDGLALLRHHDERD